MTFSAVVVSLACFLCGCAAEPRPLQIGVTDKGFSVSDRTLTTRAELSTAIRASGATDCRVTPSATAAYKQVETAFLAMQDAGCSSVIIGNMQR
jgi:biopolymer transport protein ExbD